METCGWKLLLMVGILCGLCCTPSTAGTLYPPPAGGWTYEYTGDLAAPGGDFTALDGTWSFDNGSDAWDETAIGAGNPGGITGGLADGATTYARLQETGDPRDYGMGDPSNRKLYLGHNISTEGAGDDILDTGVTISMRTRVATGDPLDDSHPDGGGGTAPWPAGGDGYQIHDGGKGNFSVHQTNGGTISFSLALESDGATNPTGGLLMNNLNGNAISGDIDTGEGGTPNQLALGDAAAWNEFWITIAAGGEGTHQVSIYQDGSLTPTVFDVTAGSGGDFDDMSYIGMGVGSTGQAGAFDVDSFAWAPGAIAPVPEPSSIALALLGAFGILGALRRRHGR